MELLIGAVVVIVVIAILFFEFAPFAPITSEEEIGENIRQLKKHRWFQDLLSNEEYKELIVHDNYVRKTIGKFNGSRLDSKFFRKKYRKKLQSILHQKSHRFD